jgi:hypothetical protein
MVTLAFAALHIVATWGRVDVFMWRDVGRWLHEVERFSAGELPYRDFSWQFPPMAMWVVGAVTRMLGPEVTVVWVTTSVLYVLICLLFLKYVRKLVPPVAALAVLVTGLILSAAYANFQSTPIPLGMYVPAAPLGVFFLLCAILATLAVVEHARFRDAVLGGLFCGLLILTKQDFWIPAIYLVAGAVLVLARRHEPASLRSAGILLAVFLLTVLGGLIPIVLSVGWSELPGIALGYGTASEFVGRGLPSWERMATDFNVLLVLAFLACLGLRTTGQIQGRRTRLLVPLLLVLAVLNFAGHTLLDYALNVGGQATAIANLALNVDAFRDAVVGVAEESMLHALPLLLPLSVAVLVVARYRHLDEHAHRLTLLFLLGLCVAARMRRGFEYVEWYHFLLELPVYAMAASLLMPELAVRRDVRRAVAAPVLVFALYSYWYFGVGPLTRQNDHQALRTAKGTIYVSPVIARQHNALAAALQRADPTGVRPLFVFGYASFNYFLDRRNPGQATAGLRFTRRPSQVIASVLAESPLVLDNLYFTRVMLPVARLELATWRQRLQPSFYRTYDRPYFERVLSMCKKELHTVPDLHGRPLFRLFDCPQRATRSPADESGVSASVAVARRTGVPLGPIE